MRLLLTRPMDESTTLAARLATLGHQTVLSPVIQIQPLDDVAVDLSGAQAILATSANGIRALAAATADRALPVYAVGPATAAAADAAGFTDIRVAGGDVDSLAERVAADADPSGGRLVHAAGTVLAGDLKGLLEARGFTVERIGLYQAEPAAALAPEAVDALQDGSLDGVLLFSPRSAARFVELVQAAALNDRCGTITAYCLSPAVADALAPLSFEGVTVADAPNEDSLIATLAPAAAEPDADDGVVTIAAEPVEIEAGVPAEPDVEPPESPPDRDFEAAPRLDPPFEAAAPRRSRRGIGWVAIIVVMIGAAGFGGWLWQTRQAPAPAAAGDTAAPDPRLVGRIAAVEQAQDGLARRLAALETLVGRLDGRIADAAPPAPDLTPLEDRIGRLEQALADPPPAPPPAEPDAPSGTPGAADDLAARVAALEAASRSPAAPAIDPAAFAALQSSVAALRRDGEARAQTVADETARLRQVGRGVSLVYALGRLRSGLEQGGPYPAPLTVVRDHFAALGLADEPAIARALGTLAAHAETGLRSHGQLAAEFAPVARAVVQAAAVPEDAGTFDRLLAEAGNLVTIRPVGAVAGDDAQARVARAEAALASQNLAAAVSEIDGLSGPALAAAGPWLDHARARLAALAAADVLDGEIAARFAETE